MGLATAKSYQILNAFVFRFRIYTGVVSSIASLWLVIARSHMVAITLVTRSIGCLCSPSNAHCVAMIGYSTWSIHVILLLLYYYCKSSEWELPLHYFVTLNLNQFTLDPYFYTHSFYFYLFFFGGGGWRVEIIGTLMLKHQKYYVLNLFLKCVDYFEKKK